MAAAAARRRPAAAPLLLLPLTLLLLLLLAGSGSAAATATAADDAAHLGALPPGRWLPLRRVPGIRTNGHGARRHARRLREAAYVLEGGTAVGYYTAPMQLGTPPKTFHLILDSGSSLTVVPCKACDCGFHDSQPFDPAASSTVQPLPCADATCSLSRQACNISRAGSQCEFYNLYAEGSSSGGMVYRDTLLLPRAGGLSAETLPDFAFGCAKFQTGQLYTQDADGVAGLGNGPAALPAQLMKAHSKGRPSADALGGPPGAFALCFGRTGGAMVLGGMVRPAGAPALQYVPLVPSGRGYYAVPLEGLMVAGSWLPVERSAFGRPAVRRGGSRSATSSSGSSSSGGSSGALSGGSAPVVPAVLPAVIIDSGSTFTYLATRAHRAVVKAVQEAVNKYAPPGEQQQSGTQEAGRKQSGRQQQQQGAQTSVSMRTADRLLKALDALPRSAADLGARLLAMAGARADGSDGSDNNGNSGNRAPASDEDEEDEEDKKDREARGPRPPASPPSPPLQRSRGPGAPAVGEVFIAPGPDPAGADAECWLVSGPASSKINSEYDLVGIFPDIEMVFGGGAKLRMPPERYMFVEGRRRGRDGNWAVLACLGFFDGADETVLGAVSMRDAVFEFDPIWGSRVGFADADCAALAATNAPNGNVVG